MFLLCLTVTVHLVIAASNDPCGRNNSTDIHIIGFFPCTNANDTRAIPVDNCDGIERIPIMKLALEEINERCDLLPGYRLVVDYANSACSSIPAMYHLIQQTDPSQPTKLMILGTACSGASHLMGEVAQRMLNIPQVAYTASDSIFGEDKKSYPRFYRMVAITEQIADGYVALVKELNWKRVALVSYDDDFNINIKEYTEQKLLENDVNIVIANSFTDDPNLVLDQIKEFNARIIIAWIPHNVAVQFWCSVIKYRLAGPDFVWFLPGWFRANWWAAVDGTDCTAEEMKRNLEHTLGGLGNSIFDIGQTLQSNKSLPQFKQELDAKNALERVKTDIFLNVGYVYDAVWTIVLALNSSIPILEERGLGRLEDFTYDSVEMADVFTDEIAKLSFEGVSGKISFNVTGNRKQLSVDLRQYRAGIAVPVLIYNPLDYSMNKFQNHSGETLVWQGGYVPRDAPVPVVLTGSLAEYIIVGMVASIGILSTMFFLFFNHCCSKHPVVKRSSYRLNSLILVGVFVGFVGLLLHVIPLDSDMPETFTTAVCNARVWTSELAFVVAFGALFAKIWRLYKVFFNKRLIKRKYLSDRYLFAMVAIIVAPTLVLLIVQAAAFPVTLRTIRTISEDDFSTEDTYSECHGKHEFTFSALAYAEDGLLALFSVLVAFETQKHIPKYDTLYKYHESAVINLTTILAILLSSVCQAILIILQLNKVPDGVLLVTTLRDGLWLFPIIYLLFVPKVYRVSCGVSSDEKKLTRYISNPFYSVARSSISLPGRRGSAASILSDRRLSYQFGRRCSDVSIVSDKSTGTDVNTDNPSTVKRVKFFTTIHEHSEEVPEHSDSMENTQLQFTGKNKTVQVGEVSHITNDLFVELLEEPKSPNIFYYKSTEV